ncbi:MAG: SpoIID/LytB domain-containing protein [Elusimicrobiaceae bacterium]|nr:SpoIID/LytB domain-containing protein [Elusimicrobiaceae bacterium]
MLKTTRFLTPLFCAVWLTVACAVPSAKRTSAPAAPWQPAPAAPAQPVSPTTDVEEKTDPLELPAQAPQADQSSSAHALKIVRVLLADNQSSAEIKHSGRVYIYTQDLEKKYKVSADGTLTVRFAGNGNVQVGTLKSNQPIIIEPAKDTLLTWNNNVYSGKFFVVPAQHTFLLVEHADLETYLYGVLPYEMSYSWPIEALKAQAVAARTYTLKTLEHVKNKYFDLYSDVRSQMYKGGGKQYPSVKEAVDGTKSQVLTFNDKLFYTYYHGNCGGGTDSVSSWNPHAKSIKPLAGAICEYDSHSKSHSWKQEVPMSKIKSYTQKEGLGGNLKSIKVAHKTHTGRATQLLLQTSKGKKTVACNPFRLAMGLKSCKIKEINIHGNHVRFEGRGYGHGVGMCQDGAAGMARSGKKYTQILKNYYPGSTLTTLQ